MGPRICGALALVLVACTVDDDSGGDDDSVGGDGDADGDADDFPLCEEESSWAGAYLDGRGDLVLGEHPMVVVRSGPGELELEEDPSCDAAGELRMSCSGTPVPDEVWLPSSGSRVLATVDGGDEQGYGVVRSPDGQLIWEGGGIFPESTDGRRFRLVDDPAVPSCTDSRPVCWVRALIRAAVLTDAGEVEIASGEHALVNVEGEEFVAVVSDARRTHIVEPGCITDGGDGLFGSGYLARTTALELPRVEPTEAPTDDCPVAMPAERGPCTTRAGLQCDYEWGGGCIDSYECRGCFWRTTGRSQPNGVDCGIDPWDCMTNGDDGACSEEAVCTDCSCPDPIGERWRCVQPGDGCPACG